MKHLSYFKKVCYSVILFCFSNLSYASGLMSLSALDTPFLILILLSSLLSLSCTFYISKKIKNKYLWLLLPVVFTFIAALITVIFFLSIYLIGEIQQINI